MRTIALSMLAMTLLLSGCTLFNKEDEKIKLRNEQITQISKSYLQEHYPTWLQNERGASVINDQGDMWEFTYTLPPASEGGVPVVLLDKSTMQVVRVYHTQ